MTNGYKLTQKDLINLNLKPTKAKEYYIEQSGWSCKFFNMYEIVKNEYGLFKGALIIEGDKITGDQEDYIIRNCKHEEY